MASNPISPSRSNYQIAFAPSDSQRITSADEGCFLHFRGHRNYNVRTGARNNHAAASGLSRRVAELRRRDRYAVANFLGQQRFRTWKN
jgi:hypothetical protein